MFIHGVRKPAVLLLGLVAVVAGGPYFLARRASAEVIVLQDGRTITGSVIGFDDGKYRVRVGQEIFGIETNQIYSIDGQVIGTGRASAPQVEKGQPSAAQSDYLESLQRGKKFLQEKMYDQAIVELNKAIRVNFSSIESRKLLGKCYIAKEHYAELLRTGRMLIRFAPQDPDGYRFSAIAYDNMGREKDADQNREKQIELTYEIPEISYHKAHYYLERNELGQAKKFWAEYRKEDPELKLDTSESQLYRRALADLAKGEYNNAFHNFERIKFANAIFYNEIIDLRFTCLSDWSMSLLLRGDFDSALARSRKADTISKDPGGRNVRDLYNKGLISAFNGQLLQSLEYFNRAYTLRGVDSDYRQQLLRSVSLVFQKLYVLPSRVEDITSAVAIVDTLEKYFPSVAAETWFQSKSTRLKNEENIFNVYNAVLRQAKSHIEKENFRSGFKLIGNFIQRHPGSLSARTAYDFRSEVILNLIRDGDEAITKRRFDEASKLYYRAKQLVSEFNIDNITTDITAKIEQAETGKKKAEFLSSIDFGYGLPEAENFPQRGIGKNVFWQGTFVNKVGNKLFFRAGRYSFIVRVSPADKDVYMRDHYYGIVGNYIGHTKVQLSGGRYEQCPLIVKIILPEYISYSDLVRRR